MKKLLVLLIAVQVLPAMAFEGYVFKPLTGNPFEPRIGAMYEGAGKKVRLDIGSQVDLASFSLPREGECRIGADFFTWTRLRSEGNLKFPVETSDYYFGMNSTCSTKVAGLDVEGRLRLAHISSHLVDGYSKSGVFNSRPFVYSREFVDAAAAVRLGGSRLYGGLIYVFSTKPKDVNAVIPEVGADCEYKIVKDVYFKAGYDFKLIGINDVYAGANSLQAGILLKTSGKTGVQLNANFYEGRSMHGMFYNKKDSYGGLGFQFYFW